VIVRDSYVRLHIDCNPSTVHLVNQDMLANEDVLRSSVLKQPEGLYAVRASSLALKPIKSLRRARQTVSEAEVRDDGSRFVCTIRCTPILCYLSGVRILHASCTPRVDSSSVVFVCCVCSL
jgi:hypothetical protein